MRVGLPLRFGGWWTGENVTLKALPRSMGGNADVELRGEASGASFPCRVIVRLENSDVLAPQILVSKRLKPAREPRARA